jgi:hypothetical protein
MTTFGDLRSAAHRRPSRENFQRLIELLRAADAPADAVRAEWVPYLESALGAWPDDARACVGAALRELERRDAAWSRLVRTLDYAEDNLSKTRVRALTQAAHLAHVTRLDLRASRVTWPLLCELSEAAPFARLEALALRKSSMSRRDEPAFGAFWASPMLSELSELDIDGWSKVNGRRLEMIWQALDLARLEVIDLSETGASSRSLRPIFERDVFSGLRVVRMRGLNVPMKALHGATHLTALEELDTAGHGNALSQMPSLPEHLRQLERWVIRGGAGDPASLDRLLEPEVYPRLTELDVSGSVMGEEGFARFAGATCFPALERLAFDDAELGSVDALERMEGFTAVRRFSFDHGVTDAAGWGHLARAPFYHQLTSLSAYTQMGRRAHEHYEGLLAYGLPPGLEELHLPLTREAGIRRCMEALEGNRGLRSLAIGRPNNTGAARARLSDETTDALAAHPACASLEYLSLGGHDPSRAQVERIVEAFPDLRELHVGDASDDDLGPWNEDFIGSCRVIKRYM